MRIAQRTISHLEISVIQRSSRRGRRAIQTRSPIAPLPGRNAEWIAARPHASMLGGDSFIGSGEQMPTKAHNERRALCDDLPAGPNTPAHFEVRAR
jgi:hypothetical protein